MKTRLFAFAALGIALTACTNDNEAPSDGPVAARIIAEISDAVATRAGGTSWDDNDRIGLTGIGTQYDNVPYIMNGGTFKEDGKPIYFHTTEDVVFRAYYPYDEDGGTLTAITDAAAQQNQPVIDFLYATGATASTRDPEVNFTDGNPAGTANPDPALDHSFHHCMSQITLTFEAGDGIDFSTIQPESYTLSELVLEGSFDTATGIAKADENTQPVDLTMELGSTLTSSVILFPQAKASIDLTVEFNDNEYSATLEIPDDALAAGNNYTYTVTVHNKGLSIQSPEITPWTPVSIGDVSANL